MKVVILAIGCKDEDADSIEKSLLSSDAASYGEVCLGTDVHEPSETTQKLFGRAIDNED